MLILAAGAYAHVLVGCLRSKPSNDARDRLAWTGSEMSEAGLVRVLLGEVVRNSVDEVAKVGVGSSRSQPRTYIDFVSADSESSDVLDSNSVVAESLMRSVAKGQTALEDGGIPSVLLEGLGCVASGLLPSSLFLGSDGDLLVEAEHFNDGLRILALELGACIEVQAPGRLAAISLPGDGVGSLELRSHSLTRLSRWLPELGLRTSDLVERSRVTDQGIRVLSAPDQLLQAAGHVYLHSLHRPPGLRVFVDLAASAELSLDEWGVVKHRGGCYNMLPAVRMGLALLDGLLTGAKLERSEDLRPRQLEGLVATLASRRVSLGNEQPSLPLMLAVEFVVQTGVLLGRPAALKAREL